MYCNIADLLVDLRADGRTARQAEPYRAAACRGTPDLTVTWDPPPIMANDRQTQDWDTAQYMGTGSDFARKLLDFSGFQLHASAVELGGRAWLFSGPCGIGKSTMAGRWVRLFSAGWLNDDKPALRRLAGGWTAFGTPWSGKDGISRPAGAPVGALTFLRRGEENKAVPLTPAQAIPLFLSQTPRRLVWDGMERLLTLADQFLREVPVWQLTCRDEDEAAHLARSVLCPEGEP